MRWGGRPPRVPSPTSHLPPLRNGISRSKQWTSVWSLRLGLVRSMWDWTSVTAAPCSSTVYLSVCMSNVMGVGGICLLCELHSFSCFLSPSPLSLSFLPTACLESFFYYRIPKGTLTDLLNCSHWAEIFSCQLPTQLCCLLHIQWWY